MANGKSCLHLNRAVSKRSEEGSMAAEAVILLPLVFLVMLFVVAFGRVEQARLQVANAARGAVEAAVLWPGANQATSAGEATGAYLLHSSNVTCENYSVDVYTGNYVAGGSVGVGVTCTAKLSDIAFPGLPGSLTISQEASAPIELYRTVQ